MKDNEKSRKNFLFVVFVVLVLAFGSLGSAYAITNGQPDGDDHPYVGLLVFDVDGVPVWRCSGALIASDVVLTAGHCTVGATGARVWFNEELQDEDGNLLVPDYPWGGVVAVEGTPYTNPEYRSDENPYGGGNGLPAFSYRDVGVVVLDKPVDMDEYALLPGAGFVDMLPNKTNVDVVGYGVQEMHRGGGPPYWEGLRVRLFAPSQLISGKFVHSDEFLRLTMNHGRGKRGIRKGGVCFGDSGGPDLLTGSN